MGGGRSSCHHRGRCSPQEAALAGPSRETLLSRIPKRPALTSFTPGTNIASPRPHRHSSTSQTTARSRLGRGGGVGAPTRCRVEGGAHPRPGPAGLLSALRVLAVHAHPDPLTSACARCSLPLSPLNMRLFTTCLPPSGMPATRGSNSALFAAASQPPTMLKAGLSKCLLQDSAIERVA